MLEGEADISCIQQLLGHPSLSTTQIYTQVGIRRLQEIHRARHPARPGLSRGAKTIGSACKSA